MRRVVGEHPEGRLLGAVAGVVGRPVRARVHPEPEAEVGAAGGSVVPELVVGIGHPEGGRRDVIVLQRRARHHEDGEVGDEDVLHLDPVLEEEGAAHDVVGDVALNQYPVRRVHVDGAVEALVDAAAADVRAPHVAVDVEVDGVTPHAERLPHVRQLHVGDVQLDEAGALLGWVNHDVSPELVGAELLAKTALETCLGRKLTCKRAMKRPWGRVKILERRFMCHFNRAKNYVVRAL